MQHKLWILIGAVVVIGASNPALAEALQSSQHDHESSHSHDHGAQAVSELRLDHGKKWQTDAPLRAGITAIRSLMQKNLKAIHQGELKAAQYTALGDAINTQLASIFKNCKLAPEADGMLHFMLAKIIGGVTDMKDQKQLEGRKKGAHQVVLALSSYGKFFDHPGWKNISH